MKTSFERDRKRDNKRHKRRHGQRGGRGWLGQMHNSKWTTKKGEK